MCPLVDAAAENATGEQFSPDLQGPTCYSQLYLRDDKTTVSAGFVDYAEREYGRYQDCQE